MLLTLLEFQMKSTILNVNKEQPKQPQQPQKQPNDHGKQQPSKSK